MNDASTPATAPTPVPTPVPGPLPTNWGVLRQLFSLRTIVLLAFWSWHAVWILAVVFGVGPVLLPALLVVTFEGHIPWDITACALGIMLLPCFTALAGWRLGNDHRRVFGLLYGVAGVVLALLFVRLFLIRELTAAVALLLVTLGVGAAFYAADLFGRRPSKTPGAALTAMVGYSSLLILGLWIGAAMGLYCIPGVVLFVTAIPEFLLSELRGSSGMVAAIPLILAIAALAGCCIAVVLALPFAVAVLYPRAWWRGLRAWREQRSLASGLGVTAAVIATWLVALFALAQQPQQAAFARLEQRPSDRGEQLDNAAATDQIRRGLLNAYLAPHRYWGANGNNVQLARLYREAFGTDQDVSVAQQLFNLLAAPLLYDGEGLMQDRQRASMAYERFFDRPLQDGEREAVVAAITATYDRSQAEAGLLDEGSRNVLLIEQDLRTTTTGDLARFELHEAYENQTIVQQEVFYYFNLPERAAITGLWLSGGAEPERRFAFTVAPRGAAQAVYREQRRQRVDPALIEQIGPRQYRLRIFPIPAAGRADVEPVMHLWMEWSALADGAGWSLPRLAAARNVYWDDDDTRRTIDGRASEHQGWLPPRLAAAVSPESHELVIDGYRVRAQPARPTGHPEGRLAVVVDTSLSMRDHADEVRSTLDELVTRGLDFDLYVSPSPWSADRPQQVSLADFDPDYYGGHTFEGVLADFAASRGGRAYGAVIVVTDGGSFAFLSSEQPIAVGRQQQSDAEREAVAHASSTIENLAAASWPEPIWMLHLGGLPHAYRDQLTDLIRRTHGGVETRLDPLIARLASAVVDDYAWEFEATHEQTSAAAGDGGFAAIAASALIGHLGGGHLGGGTADLDALHAIAKRYAVVTPWSSMIVLVDDAQRRALKAASEADDRFDREAESGVEATTTPNAALEVSGTPEPHEWMLLALASLGLLAISRGRRSAGLTAV